MHSFDPGHAGGVGKVITSPGIVMPMQDSTAVAFGARGEYPIALLTTDNNEFERQVRGRRGAIQRHLAPFGVTPMVFMAEMNKAVNGGEAISESVFDGAYIDSGSGMFADGKFYDTNSSESAVAGGTSITPVWRTINSPALEYFSEGYIIKQLPSIIATFTANARRNNRDRRREVIDQRKRLVVDAFSMLSAISSQIMHITNGKLTYVPDGHCIYIATSKDSSKTSEVCFIINDPVGTGWKVMDKRFRDAFEATGKPDLMTPRLEMLVEFSSKCVADALLKMGTDSCNTQNIVNSMKFSQSLSPSYSPGGASRLAVLTSGNSTTSGLGTLTLITEDGSSHQQVFLSEFRVSLTMPRDDPDADDNGDNERRRGHQYSNLSFNIVPKIRGDKGITSPSILKWFPAFTPLPMDSPNTEEGEEAEGQQREIREQEWDAVPVYPVSFPKKWKACKIDDTFNVNSGKTWKNKLVRLHNFDWSYKLTNGGGGRGANRLPTSTEYAPRVFERLSMMLDMVGCKKIHDMCCSTRTRRGVNSGDDSGTPPSGLINAAAALTDLYGFVDERPIIQLKKEKNEFGKGDREKYIISIVGNAPDGTSVRVLRIEKEKNFALPVEVYEKERDEMYGAIMRDTASLPVCKWDNIPPSTLVGYDQTSTCNNNTAVTKHQRTSAEDDYIVTSITCTPRCIYHTEDSYVHLYSDSEGPVEHVTYNKSSKKLQISHERPLTEGEDTFSYIDRPLVVAAIASEEAIVVNGIVTAIPLGKKSIANEKGEAGRKAQIGADATASSEDTDENRETFRPRHLFAADTVSNIKLAMRMVVDATERTLDKNLTEQMYGPYSYYTCPSEAIILQHGLYNNTSSKRMLRASDEYEIYAKQKTVAGQQQRVIRKITGFLSLAL